MWRYQFGDKYRYAKLHLERSLRLIPEKGEAAHFYSVYLKEAKKDNHGALQYANRAIVTSNEPLAIIHKARILMDLHRNQEAYAILSRFTKLGASVSGFHYAKGLLEYLAENYTKAVEEFEEELKTGDDYRTALYLGRSYFLLQDWKSSRDALKKALRLRPRGLEGHLQMALTYEQLRDYAAAMSHLETASEIAMDLQDKEAQIEVRININRLRRDRLE